MGCRNTMLNAATTPSRVAIILLRHFAAQKTVQGVFQLLYCVPRRLRLTEDGSYGRYTISKHGCIADGVCYEDILLRSNLTTICRVGITSVPCMNCESMRTKMAAHGHRSYVRRRVGIRTTCLCFRIDRQELLDACSCNQERSQVKFVWRRGSAPAQKLNALQPTIQV